MSAGRLQGEFKRPGSSTAARAAECSTTQTFAVSAVVRRARCPFGVVPDAPT
jgi:hypothetical protein